MELSETQKTLLAMLKNRDPERYWLKLEQYGTKESEIIEYIYKEQERIKSLKKINAPTTKKPEGYMYYGREAILELGVTTGEENKY